MVSDYHCFSVCLSTQEKLPVAGFLCASVRKKSCQWQVFCVASNTESCYDDFVASMSDRDITNISCQIRDKIGTYEYLSIRSIPHKYAFRCIVADEVSYKYRKFFRRD